MRRESHWAGGCGLKFFKKDIKDKDKNNKVQLSTMSVVIMFLKLWK